MKTLILAGGQGTRLWPLSRKKYPKQFLKLNNQPSFLQQTLKRHLAVQDPCDIFILTNEDYRLDVEAQAHEISPEMAQNIIVEPVAKNTAGALALGVAFLQKECGASDDEILFVSPADHIIAPESAFCDYVQQAAKLASAGRLVTFGVRPTSPETGYGYIQTGKPFMGGFEVASFVEKPDSQTAQSYLLEGNYFWNAGMFLFSIETFLAELKEHAPEFIAFDDFAKLPNISIDYALMEKSKKVCVLPLDLSWSDVGSWENLYDLFDKDDAGNVAYGQTLLHHTSKSLVYADSRLVATIGIDDLCIIETDDVVLVAKKGMGQEVKEVVKKLSRLGRKEVAEHLTIHRPWGEYTILGEGHRFKIKRITVDPNQRLSLQKHFHRSEHWVVVKGTAEVTIDDSVSCVHEGESIFVPKTSIHRVFNPGKVPLEIIEVQVGEYLGEDDIIRLEDIYGRLKQRPLAGEEVLAHVLPKTQ